MASPKFLKEWLKAWILPSSHNSRCVAVSYALGEGVQKDESRARYWYRRAANAGDTTSMYDLGLMLVYGEGGPVDEQGGRVLLMESARKGDGMAQKILAQAYMRGLWGFPVDSSLSQKWGDLAQAQGMQVW